MAYKAIIAGASGLIGSNLLQILLDKEEYDEVLVLVRKELPLQHKKLVQLIINFDKLDEHKEAITGYALFSCLGTTRRKTPDREQYRKIDHDYPVKLAQLAAANGVKHYHLVSSIGANSNSSVFYIRLKGETEDDVEKAGVRSLHIYRPSLLTGNRPNRGTEEKIVTAIYIIINPLLLGGLKKYRSIPAATVANAMYKKSLEGAAGTFIHISDKIKTI